MSHLCRVFDDPLHGLWWSLTHIKDHLYIHLCADVKGGKGCFSHLRTPLVCALKVILWYTFAYCQRWVKSVIKICDSCQRFAKDVVEDACDAGQKFIKCAAPSALALLVRASRLHVYHDSSDPRIKRFFFSCLLGTPNALQFSFSAACTCPFLHNMCRRFPLLSHQSGLTDLSG